MPIDRDDPQVLSKLKALGADFIEPIDGGGVDWITFEKPIRSDKALDLLWELVALSAASVEELVSKAARKGRIISIRVAGDSDDDFEPRRTSPSRPHLQPRLFLRFTMLGLSHRVGAVSS